MLYGDDSGTDALGITTSTNIVEVETLLRTDAVDVRGSRYSRA